LNASVWTRLPEDTAAAVEVSIDGRPFSAREGDSVAAALLAAGIVTFRTTFSGAPRAPLCMMGACFECLVTIDGHARRQACMVVVRPGIAIETSTR
jgi:predicted molibdopterin-dependent oxidoreductase YjgC